MDGPFSFGPHRALQVGELLEFQMNGKMSRDDAVVLHDRLGAMNDEHGRAFLLCDLTHASSVHPDARRYMSEWNKTHTGATGVAVFGASFAMRVIGTLLINAIHLVGRNKIEIVFFRDEAEARQWLDDRRARPRT
jgi:S-adenosylmethionine:diacylglycerol 3-amino-3-carboxypropyl transferase